MNRRQTLKLAGAAALLPAFKAVALSPLEALMNAPASPTASVRCKLQRLNLRHTWTTTMSSSDYRETAMVEYRRDGLVG